MTCRIGLREAKVWNMNQKELNVVLCVLDMRFERTALYAYENDFKVITSSLALSCWKDMDQINDQGSRLLLITME